MTARNAGFSAGLSKVNWFALITALGVIALVVVVSSFLLGLGDTLGSARVQARVLADNATAALVFEDDKAVEELLRSLRHSPDIDSASFVMKNGRVFRDYHRKDVPRQAIPTHLPSPYLLRPTYLLVSEPVRTPLGEVARLHLRVTLIPVYKETASLTVAMIVAMLLTLGMAFKAMIGKIQRSDARNTALLNAIPDLLFEVDQDGRYIDYHGPHQDPQAPGSSPLPGRLVSDVLPPAAAEVCMSALRDAAENGTSTGKQFEMPMASGMSWFELYVSRKGADDGSDDTYIVLSRDITAHKEAEQRVARLAYYDSLTGLPNRQSFLDRVNREIKRAEHNKGRFAVLFMDIDGFKSINDTLGHSTGDLILQSAADRLREGLRPSDVVARPLAIEQGEVELARMGGDEFTALILDGKRPEDSMLVAQRILTMMRRPYVMEGRELTLTASIGISLYPDDGHDAATLLKHADTAMYHAKGSGRDNCQFYKASLTRLAMQQLEMKAMLRTALERDEFSIAYQPQVCAASGRIHSVEALIRWNHPTLGSIPPLDFIPLAEENGSILAIGRWVLETACADAAKWQCSGNDVKVAVNLSPLQCKAPDLLDMVHAALAGSGLAPELLELEITEGALMEDTEAMTATLNSLRDCGVRIALDDFGTGYSSLAYLKRLPLANVKVDRSFVNGLPDDSENLAIVRAIMAMSHSLGLSVTAEGVETLEQAMTLKSMNCDYYQGYYFSRPVPGTEIPGLLARNWKLVQASGSTQSS